MYFIYGIYLLIISWSLHAQPETPHYTYEHLEQAAQEDKPTLLQIRSTTRRYTPEQCRRLQARKIFYSELARFPNPEQDYLQKKSKELENELKYCEPLTPTEE